jgi:DNA-binding HxlR family transcriptional regulator
VGDYGQFCPVAKAAEVLCQRWAILVVREALNGSRRFSELQRGVPGCPPATLTKRLRELESAGVLTRTGGGTEVAYDLTDAGWELYPLVEGFGRWGQRWVRSTYPPEELDVELLLWDMRRFLQPGGLGVERAVVQLDLRMPDDAKRCFWVVVEPAAVDLCMVDPARPVDAVLEARVEALTRVWMGDTRMDDAVASGEIVVRGPAPLAGRIPGWIGTHPVLGAVPAARSERAAS